MIFKENKIGILGGSFDTAHKGHLVISKIAAKKFKLKKVIWAITKKNPFKEKSNSNLATRIKFCKKIIEKVKFIKIQFYEDLIKSNKTIDLINYLTKDKKMTFISLWVLIILFNFTSGINGKNFRKM